MKTPKVDYDFLLHPPVMRSERGDVAKAHKDARAAFRALLCEDAETSARLAAQDARIAAMKATVRGEGLQESEAA